MTTSGFVTSGSFVERLGESASASDYPKNAMKRPALNRDGQSLAKCARLMTFGDL